MPKRTKLLLPKSVSLHDGRYQVRIYSKQQKKIIYIGAYSSIQDAVNARDEWLIANYSTVEGYLPRGITKMPGKFRAQLSAGEPTKNNGTVIHIGVYDSLTEAIEARKNYILSLL